LKIKGHVPPVTHSWRRRCSHYFKPPASVTALQASRSINWILIQEQRNSKEIQEESMKLSWTDTGIHKRHNWKGIN